MAGLPKKDDETRVRERIIAILTRFEEATSSDIAMHIRPYKKGWRTILNEMIEEGVIEHVVGMGVSRSVVAFRLSRAHTTECTLVHKCTGLCVHRCSHHVLVKDPQANELVLAQVG